MGVIQSLISKKTAPIFVVVGVWFVAILAQGIADFHNYRLVSVDFALSGQFGDSFGPLSTLMAAIAAASALMAFTDQRRELDAARALRADETKSAKTRDFESTFFNLVELLRNTVQEMSSADFSGKDRTTGRDAMKQMLRCHLEERISAGLTFKELYDELYDKYRDELGHYFRTLYHVVRFVDQSENIDKMRYIRILRATLSNAEIVLLGLNCQYGGGREKFKQLVERYALLHNISSSYAERWELIRNFDAAAFGSRVVDRERWKLGQ